jgi:hypothetical protein
MRRWSNLIQSATHYNPLTLLTVLMQKVGGLHLSGDSLPLRLVPLQTAYVYFFYSVSVRYGNRIPVFL